MKFRGISIRWMVWVGLIFVMGCGQGGDVSTQTSERKPVQATEKKAVENKKEPIDRHVGRLILTKHARCRMGCRHITEHEIREVLENGEINYKKSEPDAHPDPKYALEGVTEEGQHLRIIFAVPTGRAGAENSLVVVTCIELGVEWTCDCK